MFCLYILHQARQAQARLQMLTTSSCIVKSIPGILVNFYVYFRSEIQYSIDDDTESLHKELDPDLNTTTPIIKPSSNNKPKGNSSPLASNGDLKGKY